MGSSDAAWLAHCVPCFASHQRSAGHTLPGHSVRTHFPDTAKTPAARRTQMDTAGHSEHPTQL
eukprot:13354635-Alexandrium_andersonii.AAC.1